MKGISNCEIRIADCTTTMDKNPEWGGRGDWGEGIGNCGEDLRKPIGRKRVGWWNEKIEVRIGNHPISNCGLEIAECGLRTSRSK